MGRHSRRGAGRKGKQALAIGAAAGSEGLGIFLVTWGNHLSAMDYTYDLIPWALWGAFFIAAPFLVLVLWIIAAITKAVAEHARHRAWKASLPPEQRMAVELAETAAAVAAALAMWEHHKRLMPG